MRIASIVLLGGLVVFALGCGYSSKAPTPQPGVTPAIAQLVPAGANAGAPAFTLTVNGSSFSTTATINWNGAAQNTTHVSASELTTIISASDIAKASTVPVSVTNPATPGMGGIYGTGGTQAETSNVMNFAVN
jgi:hypothetical protein